MNTCVTFTFALHVNSHVEAPATPPHPPSSGGHNAGLVSLQYWQSQLKIALLPRHNKMMRQVPLFGVCMPRVELLLLFLSWSTNRCCIHYPTRLSCATAPPHGGTQRCTRVGEIRLRGRSVEESGFKFCRFYQTRCVLRKRGRSTKQKNNHVSLSFSLALHPVSHL